MPDYQTFIAIVLMALTTYATRVTAYLILRNRVLTPRAMTVLKSSPGCVMLAFIAPFFCLRKSRRSDRVRVNVGCCNALFNAGDGDLRRDVCLYTSLLFRVSFQTCRATKNRTDFPHSILRRFARRGNVGVEQVLR